MFMVKSMGEFLSVPKDAISSLFFFSPAQFTKGRKLIHMEWMNGKPSCCTAVCATLNKQKLENYPIVFHHWEQLS